MGKQVNDPLDKVTDAVITASTNRRFLKELISDLMSESEIRAFAMRITAAELLCEGGSQRVIGEKLGKSHAFVARVQRAMKSRAGALKAVALQLAASQRIAALSEGAPEETRQ